MQDKAHPFWKFSLQIYAKPGVDLTCMALQDEYGGDVNLLLFCCWQGCMGRSLNKRFMRKVMAAVADWQLQVVQPLRLARRNISKGYPAMPPQRSMALRNSIANAELDAEYLEQLLLVRCLAENSSTFRKSHPAMAIAANLRRYFNLLEIPLEVSIQQHAEVLLAASRSNPPTGKA